MKLNQAIPGRSNRMPRGCEINSFISLPEPPQLVEYDITFRAKISHTFHDSI